MRILIDGTDYDLNTDVQGDFIVEHQKSDGDGSPVKSFTEEITVFGAAFEYFKALFVDDPSGKFNSAEIVLIDDCCGEERIVFTGAVFGESVEWCEGDCFIKFRSVQDDSISRTLDCIRSTMIYDNHDGFQQQQHPRMVYCNEARPAIMQDFVLIIGIIVQVNFLLLTPIVGIIIIIVNVINAIIAAVNTLPFVNIDPISFGGQGANGLLNQLGNLITTLNSFIIGCGRRHPSPLVREYIDNVCRKCGIEWSSSILKNPASEYYNSVLYSAPIEKGKRPLNPFGAITTWIDENKPIDTLETFLDKLRIVFNAQWRVGEDGVLRFERRDFFDVNSDWIEYSNLLAENRIDEVICYSWRDEDTPAVLNIEYSLDAVDWCGNEALPRFNEVVELNLPVSQRQKGIRDVLIPFGVARFRDDGIDRDVIGDYGWFPLYSQAEQIYRSAIIQPNGTSFQPKLLIWDGENVLFGKVKRYATPNLGIPFNENYNFPYSANDFNAAPATVYPTNHPSSGIYPRFYSIDDPRVLTDKGKNYTFTFKFTCDELAAFNLDLNVLTPMGSGRINSVRINYSKRIATVNGSV